LTAEEVRDLEQLYQHGKSHYERRRAHFILLSNQGHRLNETAALVGMSRKAAGRTMRCFETGGIAALLDHPRLGRTPKLGPEQREQIDAVLRHSPQEFGYATNNWTGPLLVDYIQKTFGISLSDDRACILMHRLGFRRVRARRKISKGDTQAK